MNERLEGGQRERREGKGRARNAPLNLGSRLLDLLRFGSGTVAGQELNRRVEVDVVCAGKYIASALHPAVRRRDTRSSPVRDLLGCTCNACLASRLASNTAECAPSDKETRTDNSVLPSLLVRS